jgi:uncharacterized protein YijF (DUF1287 family)
MNRSSLAPRVFALSVFSLVIAGRIQFEAARQLVPIARPRLEEISSIEIRTLLASAMEQTRVTKGYDPRYVVLKYPNGDVPMETGVCSDVLIRAFRNLSIDLQKEVHEDMAAHFSLYPQNWGLRAPDSNIDHRRVPNLQTWFSRKGKSVPISTKAGDYRPGDIVAWDLNGKGILHIGFVSNLWSETSKRYWIIHNIGGGTQAEDRLFDWKVIGHYRYF